MPLTDADLVARVLLDDDHHAFAELVRNHQSSVRGLLRQLARSDVALADDLAQETFLSAYKNLRSFRGEAKIFDLALPDRLQLFPRGSAEKKGTGWHR